VYGEHTNAALCFSDARVLFAVVYGEHITADLRFSHARVGRAHHCCSSLLSSLRVWRAHHCCSSLLSCSCMESTPMLFFASCKNNTSLLLFAAAYGEHTNAALCFSDARVLFAVVYGEHITAVLRFSHARVWRAHHCCSSLLSCSCMGSALLLLYALRKQTQDPKSNTNTLFVNRHKIPKAIRIRSS
jgi:hypothetical protein